MLLSVGDLIKQVKQNIRCIDAQTAVAERQQNKGLLIDVREPAEHLMKPAVGAINIPRGLLEMKMMELEKDPTRPIYLHCATSARAALGAEQLKRVGYKNVTVITCQMDEIQRCCEL
ncbi:rhodanese-like domain-containing protein [Paraglaciecola sp.]|uniref:rhodanese-like domain-containing protein n=1 Tax=Paraglaciecola sp. TaxID=1920173 RepID=UPI0030F49194